MTQSLAVNAPIQYADTRCGRIVGLLLLCYGLFNTYLYMKFTPVYTATECGDQAATLDKLELGESSIHVGLKIQVTCLNPNPYSIDILTSENGQVFVGQEDPLMLGELRVMPGSKLPEKGNGIVQVRMDTELSGHEAEDLLPHFLSDAQIPLMLKLNFNVGVSISFGISTFATTAPFMKECGLNMAGLLKSTSNGRLGPMVCVDSFENLVIPPVTAPKPTDGNMAFSAAQMDPERIQMGERMKNVSIVNVMLICYCVGLMLLRTWFSEVCCGVQTAVKDRLDRARGVVAIGSEEDQVVAETSGAFRSLVSTVLKHTPFVPEASRRYGYTAAQGKELLQVEAQQANSEEPSSTMEQVIGFFNCRSSKRGPPATAMMAAKPEEAPTRTPRWGFSSNV